MTEAPIENQPTQKDPWVILQEIVESRDVHRLNSYLDSLTSGETARAISRLDQDTQSKLMVLLDPEDAAELIEDLPEAQAADIIDDLPDEQAAAIVEEMPSDQQADLLAALPRDEAEDILKEMDPEEAKDARFLMQYAPDTAGGIMVREFLEYEERMSVRGVLDDLRENAETYSHYDVLYAYVVDSRHHLVGVVKLRDLLLAPNETQVGTLMSRDVVKVNAKSTLDDLSHLFERHEYFGVPVVDDQNYLVGVVKKESLQEALETRTEKSLMAAAGILGGEELRSLPKRIRVLRRLSFLILKIGLNLISASVIGIYSDTLGAVVALALFLPIISDLGGVSGNQALAVSIRELTLGVIKPKDYFLVLWSEMKVGLSLGALMGLILGVCAALWKHNFFLGLVVGVALALNTLVAVCVGGVVPLILRRFRVDPAIASSGILTFVTDAFGFFVVLALATRLLQFIQP